MHAVNQRRHYIPGTVRKYNVRVKVGSGYVRSTLIGDVLVFDRRTQHHVVMKVQDVIYLPECGRILIAEGRFGVVDGCSISCVLRASLLRVEPSMLLLAVSV